MTGEDRRTAHSEDLQTPALRSLIGRARRIAFFGGAGVSTESGIPDFRSAQGLYAGEGTAGASPETVLSEGFFLRHTEAFFEWYRAHMLHPDARPNAAHRALADLERAGKLRGLVTQNVDGLHRLAGSRALYELHGTVTENECVGCGAEYPLPWLLATEGVPRCPECGAVVKPRVVLYGEPLNEYVMRGAAREIASCDTLIVAGTSLTVAPAASLTDRFQGDRLIVINRTPTPLDDAADLVIRAPVARVFAALRPVNG